MLIYCEYCYYLGDIKDSKSIFIDNDNFLVCSACLDNLTSNMQIVLIKSEMEEEYISTLKYKKPKKLQCNTCNKNFSNKITYDNHRHNYHN